MGRKNAIKPTAYTFVISYKLYMPIMEYIERTREGNKKYPYSYHQKYPVGVFFS